MKPAKLMYKELSQKENNKNDLAALYTELDEKIVKSLTAEGYGTDDIEQAITSESYAVKNKPKQEVDAYLLQHVERNLASKKGLLPSKDAYLREKQKFYYRFEQLFLKKDLNIVCKMLDDKYPLKDTIQAVKDQSVFAVHISGAKNLTSYMDKVFHNINTERILRAGKVYELAKDSYIEKATAITDKYASSSKANYSAFHEGNVVVSMMINDHFFPEVIEQVLHRNSFYPKADDSYVKDIMDKCRKIQQSYQDIACAVSAKNVKTEDDAYRFFAREYMEHTHTSILNGRDDRKIVARMFKEKFPRTVIEKALQASPVSIEPGRNKDKYISTIIALVEDKYANRKAYSEKQYSVTKAMYDEKLEWLAKKLKEKGYINGIDKNRSYYDRIIARELLEEHQPISNIIRAIKENSPQAVKKTNNPNKTPEGYANWIVNSAQKVLSAEKAIIHFNKKSIPNNVSYKQLMKMGFTPLDLYLQAIRERLDAYPSHAAMLTASFIDKDTVEKLLMRYPDFDKDALYKVIDGNSPRRLMPGIPEAYPGLVLNEVQERIKSVNKQKDYEKSIEKEYNRQCGLATEGVYNTNNMLSVWRDGRADLRMLLKHIDPADIKVAIVAAAKTAAIMVPLVYADDIIHKAQEVMERMEGIKNYSPQQVQLRNDLQNDSTENRDNDKENAADYYKQKLQELYEKKNFLQSSMDAAVMKNMILEDKFRIGDIRTAIKENSPIAIEPGRDDKYEDYVEAKARENIAREQQKLQNYKPIPRIEHEESAQDEYDYHKKQLQDNIDLPYTSDMDGMIAETMLTQGFTENLIADALSASPCAIEPNYGTKMINQISHAMKENTQEQALVRTLIKTNEA